LVLASLRALSNLADSAALASNGHRVDISTLAEALFVRQHLNSLCRILSQSSASITVQCQISTAASLISRICREERHQQGLANSGVLDALATRLASFVVADGLVIPGAEVLAQREGLAEYIPQAAPPNAKLSGILEAISVIIADSKFRASQLLYSPSIMAIFPTTLPTEFIANQNTRAAWNAFNAAGLSARQDQLNAVDYLLPCVPLHQGKGVVGQGSAFPPLGTSASRENLAQMGRKYNGTSTWADSLSLDSAMASHDSSPSDSEEPESPLIAYLILLLRSRLGMERLMGASVLTVLYRAGLTHKSREPAIGLLVVPLLVHMLDDIIMPPKSKDNLSEAEATSLDCAIKERAPAILAMLITDSEYLQKAAFDANIVSKLSKMLKISYDPVPEAAHSHRWSPEEEENTENIGSTQSSRLGRQGQPPLLNHKIKVRESTLKAIAALVPFKDEYRKAIVDQGMIPYIVESMSSIPSKPTPKVGDKPETAVNGSREEDGKLQYGINPIAVLIAACGAVRALSRSVSILRTTLIDNGVAMPVFNLLQHPDIEVQIAATATVCNLVTDVSPMREVGARFLYGCNFY
jgi:armadillo repeat-containing protein 8